MHALDPTTATGLTPAERNFLAGLASLGAPRSAVVRLFALRDECARVWMDTDAERRGKALGLLLVPVAADFPAGVERLHPSWIADVVESEPSGLVLALAAIAPAAVRECLLQVVRERGEGEVAAWTLDERALGDLAQLVLSPLESMLDDAAGPLGLALGAGDEAALVDEITRQGARVIGQSLAGSPLVVRARAMAAAGPPWAGEIAAAAGGLVSASVREQARRQVECAAALVPPRVSRLQAAGLIALSEQLAAEGSASILRVAGRLPMSLARSLIAATCS